MAVMKVEQHSFPLKRSGFPYNAFFNVLIAESRLRGWRVMDSRPSSTEDPVKIPCGETSSRLVQSESFQRGQVRSCYLTRVQNYETRPKIVLI
ncbi:hypothetical protein AVEN_219290-1 [Araneus ventricosus]|uniref:Uncharacterized protein n=1 Tax=Araneus ventricosus TaxID=182803 RepID=A0A4Y2BHK0_ARAVE|nr:hypothetical protein AVEN_219290-1 [Araneus ventricosus]